MDDIEQFLREAAGRTRGRRAPEVPFIEPEIVQAEVVAAPPAAEARGRPIATRHLDTSDVTEGSEALGRRPALADDLMEEHLHERFDHQLARLGDEVAEVATEYEDEPPGAPGTARRKATAAARIVDLFRTSGNARNAIVLSEILRLPEHGW